MNQNAASRRSVKVWELPIRLFHWLLVTGVIIMIVSANIDRFDVHIFVGKSLAVLLLWRIVWGFVGSSNTRFSALVFPPREYLTYVRSLRKRSPSYTTAHSPIGSLAVIAILVAVVTQISSGLIALDVDGIIEGPFAYYVSYELSRAAAEFHLDHKFWLITLIVMHLAANAFYYFYKKDNLVAPMIYGSREIPVEIKHEAPQHASPWKALIVFLVVLGISLWLFATYG